MVVSEFDSTTICSLDHIHSIPPTHTLKIVNQARDTDKTTTTLCASLSLNQGSRWSLIPRSSQRSSRTWPLMFPTTPASVGTFVPHHLITRSAIFGRCGYITSKRKTIPRLLCSLPPELTSFKVQSLTTVQNRLLPLIYSHHLWL